MASKLPHWQPERAKRLFSILFIIIAFIISLVVGLPRLIPDSSIDVYGEIAADIPNESKVMVGIAPAFYYHTGNSAVSVPNESIENVLIAAERYDVIYLILDQNHPTPLREIYTGEEEHHRVILVNTYNEEVKAFSNFVGCRRICIRIFGYIQFLPLFEMGSILNLTRLSICKIIEWVIILVQRI